MAKLTISFNEFEKHIKALKDINGLEDSISDAIRTFNHNSKDCAEFIFPNLSCNVVELLTKLVCDKNEWIDYWVFELKFGEKYEDGCVKDKDGSVIKLKTIKDLWNLIISEE